MPADTRGAASRETGLKGGTSQRVVLRMVALTLGSAVFFVLLGPAVGAVVFFADLGPIAALMVAHHFGLLPSFATGILNAFAVAWLPLSRWGRASVIAGCGFLVVVLFIEYPDWYLLTRTSGWYDVWYTFKRSYAQLSLAGALAGGVCSFIFHPWGERLLQFSAATNANVHTGT